MSIDRVGNTRLTELVPNERRHVNDDPKRSPGASGMDIALEGCQTIDRAEPRGWGTKRSGVTPPVRDSSNNEYGDAIYAPTTIYPA